MDKLDLESIFSFIWLVILLLLLIEQDITLFQFIVGKSLIFIRWHLAGIRYDKQ